jgi:hypothetical protein
MPEQGKESNDLCPGCKSGRLRHDLVSVQTGLTDRGVRGSPVHEDAVSLYLACRACSALYLAAQRGKTISEIMDVQLKAFVSQGTKCPTQCAKCDGNLQRRADTVASMSWRRLAPGGESERYRPFLWCDGCLHVAWASAPDTALDVEALNCWLRDGMLP